MNGEGNVGISPACRPRLLLLRQVVLIVAGVGVVAIAVLAGLASHNELTPITLTAGRIVAMVALALFMVQFALAGRWRLLDSAFGLDRLLQVHGVIGTTACVLVSAHPFLVFYESGYSTSLEAGPWTSYWPQLLGVVALALVWLIVATAIWGAFLDLSYEQWRWIHRLTFVLVVLGLVHAFAIGEDFQHIAWVRVAWIITLAAYAAGFVWVKIARPIGLRSRAFNIASVSQLNHNTVNVELVPAEQVDLRYAPGQFAFVRFRHHAIRPEEHPFTISSSPTNGHLITFTIKRSGDFTEKLTGLDPQGKAEVLGPFGRFSYVLCASAGEPLILIAGGIGVTPMLSMLRYLADQEDQRRVTLIWANRTEADLFFRDELDSLRRRLAGLSVHYVMSRQDDWDGPKGHVDADMLLRLLSNEDLKGRAFVCGPAGMTQTVADALHKLGMARRKIHTEQFGF